MSTKHTESKFDIKQFLPLAGAAVVGIGIVLYFSSKNRKLSSHIEELAQKIDEQEDQIQKLEGSINQVNTVLMNMSQRFASLNNNSGMNSALSSDQKSVQQSMNRSQQHSSNQSVRQSVPKRKKTKVSFPPVVQEIKKETQLTVDDVDSDSEIRDELDELEIDTEKSLKKQE